MGIYQSDYLFAGSVPFFSPKLCILVMYYEMMGAITGDVEFRVYLPSDEADKPSVSLPLTKKDLPLPPPPPADAENGEERIFHAMIPINLAPFMIAKEGRLKVRAHYADGKILRLGTLNVRPLKPEEAATLGIQIPPVDPPIV
jgi:hypothetical protein